MKTSIILAIFIALSGCAKPELQGSSTKPSTCKGIFYQRDGNGNLKKFNEYQQNGQCLTDAVALTHWEKTSDAWERNKTQCTPQPGFPSRTLITASNFYAYRDGKVFLDLDSSRGVFRRLVFAEDEYGKPLFARLQGCFYFRVGSGIDAQYGSQLLPDTEISKTARSQYFDPMEIYTVTDNTSSIHLVRFDQSSDWDYRFCPTLREPWSTCTALRNGNDMYWPNLPFTTKTALKNEAILIRKNFHLAVTSKAEFESLWSTVEKSRIEKMREDYLYDVWQIPDTPQFIDGAWRAYVKNERPTMPDISSSQMLPLCYPGSQTVNLSNGSTGRIFGEICIDSDGLYSFTTN